MGEVVGERRRKKINGSKEGDDFWKGKGGDFKEEYGGRRLLPS